MRKFLETLVDRFFDELADRIADRLLAVPQSPSMHVENFHMADDRYTDFERGLLAKRAQEQQLKGGQ